MSTITEIPRTHNPYPTEGVVRDDRGAPHYVGLPGSLLDLLGAQVERRPDSERSSSSAASG